MKKPGSNNPTRDIRTNKHNPLPDHYYGWIMPRIGAANSTYAFPPVQSYGVARTR